MEAQSRKLVFRRVFQSVENSTWLRHIVFEFSVLIKTLLDTKVRRLV